MIISTLRVARKIMDSHRVDLIGRSCPGLPLPGATAISKSDKGRKDDVFGCHFSLREL